MGIKWSGGKKRRKVPGSKAIDRLGARAMGIIPGRKQVPLSPKKRKKIKRK